MKAPDPKLQVPKKLQAPSPNRSLCLRRGRGRKAGRRCLELGPWGFSGAWNLEFGIYFDKVRLGTAKTSPAFYAASRREADCPSSAVLRRVESPRSCRFGLRRAVRDLRQSRRLEILNGSKPFRPAGIGRAPKRRHSRCGGFFPLTPALSLGERVHHSLRGGQSRPVGFPLPDARCSFSLRERARVRGNGAKCHPAY